jgi:hypothetical protein
MTAANVDNDVPPAGSPGSGSSAWHRRTKFLPFLMVLLIGLAYANSFNGAFVLDGRQEILKNPNVRSMQGWSGPAWLMSRSLTDFTFAMNFATCGENPADYHATNLLIHIASALLLYGLVRRTLVLPGLAGRFSGNAPWIAFFIAAAWSVHPLTTSSVTYIWQRSESLMGMLMLSTLYLAVRAHSSSMPLLWYVSAVLSCTLGMAAKEVMITAPIVVVAYDRLLLSKSFKEMLSRKWHFLLGLCMTWAFLGFLMSRKLSESAGFGSVYTSGASFSYLLTQCKVLLHYLRLSFWPVPLCLDYGWPLTESGGDAWLAVMGVVTLGLGVLVCLRFAPAAAFLGFTFFAVLSPTSSFAPRPDNAFEHRMYIPLAAVVALLVCCAYSLMRHSMPARKRLPWNRITAVGLTVILIMLAGATWSRNRDYVSEEVMWRDIVEKRPENLRARNNLAAVLCERGETDEALDHFRHVLMTTAHLNPEQFKEQNQVPYDMRSSSPQNCRVSALANLGFLAFQQGDTDKAIACYAEALRLFPYSDLIASKLRYALLSKGVKREELDQKMRESITSARFDETWVLPARPEQEDSN